MKILQVITTLLTGGAESLLSDLVPLMNRGGNLVDVLAFDGKETPFMRKLRERGVNVLSLGMDSNVYKLSNIRKLMPIIRRYDVVHTHNTACQMYVAIAKRLSGAKCQLVTTEHNTDNRRRHVRLLKPLDMWMYRQYDAIIAISGEAAALLEKYTSHHYKVTTIANGIDISNYLNATPYEDLREKSQKVIVMVAAFRPQKDQDTLIKSMRALPQNYVLWLVGDGPRRQGCETLAKELGVVERVRFWGVRTDVPRLLKTADVVVMSTHYEGMSLSNIEGMASGRPFVASNVKGIREITEGAGVMFEEGNDKELAEIILRMTGDKAYRDAVVGRCLARAKEYDVSKTAEGYMDVYRGLTQRML